MYRKENCGCLGCPPCAGKLGQDNFSSALITSDSVTSGVISPDGAIMRYFDGDVTPIQPQDVPKMATVPCPELDCSKCPEKIVFRDRIVHVPGPATTQTVTKFVYVPVSSDKIPATGYSQSELADMYSAFGGKLPTVSYSGEADAEGADYGVSRSPKPFPWWLLAVGAGAYFLARQQ